MPTSLVLQNDQAAIDGIRETGANQLILAPGNGYTGKARWPSHLVWHNLTECLGGHSWLTISQGDAPSGDYLGNITDPMKNTAIDIHEVGVIRSWEYRIDPEILILSTWTTISRVNTGQSCIYYNAGRVDERLT